ncbi:MAG: ATP-binding protein [Chitinispirillia bacterium]|nr:ATP-binding protein [Chitinispirillia bacterium]MCL2240962.1 ATP-binding protein [Chitinispirillia bacterium]
MVLRDRFINSIRPFYETTGLVKVITGLRRAGKSVLLSQIAGEMRQNGVDEKRIIFINFEFLEFSHIRTAKELHKYVKGKMRSRSGKYYLFLDEVQAVEQFELAVNSLRAKGNVSIFITGSNAHLLSGELATALSGRYVKFRVTPFTFREALEITGEADRQKAFADFMKWGGLPGRFAFPEEQEIRKYLMDVYDSIVLRDIVQRFGIRDLNMLDNIVNFLIDNSGSLFSANTISKYIKSQNRSISAEALYNYVGHIVGSMMFTKVHRCDIKGKNVFATLEKYYIADMGMLQIKRNITDVSLGAGLETIVANELIARGYNLHIGVKKDTEIDFVVDKGGENEFIQVAYAIDSETTLRREIDAFNGIPEQKLLITADNHDYSQKGVRWKNIITWLMEPQA